MIDLEKLLTVSVRHFADGSPITMTYSRYSKTEFITQNSVTLLRPSLKLFRMVVFLYFSRAIPYFYEDVSRAGILLRRIEDGEEMTFTWILANPFGIVWLRAKEK